MNKHDSRPGAPTQSMQDRASLKEFEDASHEEHGDTSHEEHVDASHKEHVDASHEEHYVEADYEKGGSVEDFTYSLRGMEFPAEKTALVEHVRQHSANEVVMGRLGKIEDRVYDSITDVTNQIGKAA